jgi:Protein of unknown function (DUF5818)
MSKTLLLAFTLLFSTAWLYAQTYPQTEPSKTATSSSEKTTVQGCLQGSEGNYTLTDNAGMTYRLEGDSSKLSAHVGHEVQITATRSSSSAASSTTSTTTGGTHEATLNVQSVKHISKTCKSASK